jgi:diguanylate cyclase (GGDEF)-like protein
MNGLYDPDQQFIGFVGVTRDIRERKLYDAELREARDAAEAANLALLSANAVLHGQATTDPLTGVSNRRHFEQALAAQIGRTRRYGDPLSLLIVDLDHFKTINDRFGHQLGDLVIVELARLLRSSLRKTDLLARWGGDEFVVMLPHTGVEEAWQLAEQLRLSMSVHVFPVVPKLTGSFGVAALEGEETAEQFFARVDQMLYAAKAAGRNLVKFSG